MTSQPETGTPARSLPPIPDEAALAALFAMDDSERSTSAMGARIVVESEALGLAREMLAAAAPIYAIAVLEWAADELAATA